MGYESCLLEIEKAAGREFEPEELADLLTELQNRTDIAKAYNTSGNLEEAVLRAVDRFSDDLVTAALIEKRNASINLTKRLEAIDFVRTQFKGDYAAGIESLLVGVNQAKKGSRFSVDANQAQLREFYTGGFIADVEKNGLWKVFISGELDLDIAKALWQKGRQNPDIRGIPKEAQDIAEVMHKWQEVARDDANRAGAWIHKAPGYIVRQSHDAYKMRDAGFEAWRDSTMPLLDYQKTFGGAKNVDEIMKVIYGGFISGKHIKARGAGDGFKGPGNLAKKVSQERTLRFKDAESWHNYNKEFGSGNLREAFLYGISRSAENTALMRSLGTNPEANLARIIDDLGESLRHDPEQLARFVEDTKPNGWIFNRYKELDGSVNIPGSNLFARVSANIRAVQSMSKLGGAVISSIADIPVYASEMRYQGKSMLGGIGEAIGGLLKGRPKGEQREILNSLGVSFNSLQGEAAARFSGRDDLGGKMSRMQQTFFKFNGLTWWTETLRSTAALAMSNRLAGMSGKAWSAMGDDMRRVLGLFNIDEGKWDIIRSGMIRKADGNQYVIPEAVRDIPDAQFTKYLEANGKQTTDFNIRELKREIEDQLRAYYVDRSRFAVIEPDARTQAIMRQGRNPGTVDGEILRFLGQFKSFPTAILNKAVGREVYGRGYQGSARGVKGLSEALRNGNGEMLGLANLMVWTTLFGYGSMVVKDLTKGKVPRDPSDPSTWAAAMLKGGALGIYGDFLFGELKTGYGGGPIAAALGPTVGSAENVFDIIGRLQSGEDAGPQTLKFALNNTPFMNLFYTRAAMDYLFLYQVQEWMNPGYLKRMERRLKKENDQEFLIKPSQAAR